jgi:hypothetical protein
VCEVAIIGDLKVPEGRLGELGFEVDGRRVSVEAMQYDDRLPAPKWAASLGQFEPKNALILSRMKKLSEECGSLLFGFPCSCISTCDQYDCGEE